MLKFGKGIVKFRYVILVLSVLLLIPSVIGYLNTRINYDILYYLPDNIETMKGQDIFSRISENAHTEYLYAMGLDSAEQIEMKEKVEAVDHVADVICYNAITEGTVPEEMLPDEVRDVFYSKDGKGCLMFIFFDSTSSSDETMDAITKIREVAGEQCMLSSMVAVVTDNKEPRSGTDADIHGNCRSPGIDSSHADDGFVYRTDSVSL